MRGFLATLAILVVVALTMAFFGWLTFTEAPDGAGATIHTERIEEDVEHAAETTKDAVSDVADTVSDATEDTEEQDPSEDEAVRDTEQDSAQDTDTTEPVNRETGRPIE